MSFVKASRDDAHYDGRNPLRCAGAASMLEAFARAAKPLTVGKWTQLPPSVVSEEPSLPAAGALVLDVKMSRTRWAIVDAGDTLVASCQG